MGCWWNWQHTRLSPERLRDRTPYTLRSWEVDQVPYKDPEKAKQARQDWYQRNADKVRENSKRHKQDRQAELNKLKESNPCADCGKFYPAYVMDFDHLGDKVASVAAMMKNRGWQTILEEIAKCELVCSNCHRIRTWKRNQQ